MSYTTTNVPLIANWIQETPANQTNNQRYRSNTPSTPADDRLTAGDGGPEINTSFIGAPNLRIGGGTVGPTENDRAWAVIRPQDGQRDIFGGSLDVPSGNTLFAAILTLHALSADKPNNWETYVVGDNNVAGNNWPSNWLDGEVHWGSIADNADQPCLHNGGSSARGQADGGVGVAPTPSTWSDGGVITFDLVNAYWTRRFDSADNNGFVLLNNGDNQYAKFSNTNIDLDIRYGHNLTGLGGSAGSERIDASWTAQPNVDNYYVYLDGVFQGATGATSWYFGGLNPGQSYNVQVYPNYSPYGFAGGQGFNITTVALVARTLDVDTNFDIFKAYGPKDVDTNFDITKAILRDADTNFDIFVAIVRDVDVNIDLTRSRGPIDADVSIFIGEIAETVTRKVFTPVEGVMIDLIGASRVLTYVSDDDGVTWVDATLITMKPLTHENLHQNILSNGDVNVSLTPRYVNGNWTWQTAEQFSAGGAAKYTAPSNAAPVSGDAELINTYTVPSDTILRGGVYRASVWGKYDTSTDQQFSAGTTFIQVLYKDGTTDQQEILDWATQLQFGWQRFSGTITANASKDIDKIRMYHQVVGQSPCLYDPYNNPTLFAYLDVEVIQLDERDDDADFRAVQFPVPGRDLKLKFLLYDPDSCLSGYRMTPLYTQR